MSSSHITTTLKPNFTKSKCTTPFTIGKLDITSGQRSSLFVFNIAILLVNIMANSAAIFALIKSQPLRRRPAIVLIFYLCLSDLTYAIISQTLFSIKMFNPELPCIYDLTFEFSSSVLGNLSLCIVVLISISRYLHTRYMMRVRSIITKERVRLAVTCSFGVAMVFSSVAAFGSSYGDIGVYIQTQTFVTAIGVGMILFVVAIYRKTEIIARKRKAASQYEMRYNSVKVLKKIMLSTLATLLPLRIPFFASTVFKSVVTEIYKQRLTWWMQYMHLSSYEILCLSAGANALIFLYNNSFARRFIIGTVLRWVSYISCCSTSGALAVVEPIEDEIISPGIAPPVVTTGWYDRYIPTTAPTTLSTAVVGKKISQEQIKQQKIQRKKQKQKIKRKLKKEEEKLRKTEIEIEKKLEKQRKAEIRNEQEQSTSKKVIPFLSNIRKYEIHWKKKTTTNITPSALPSSVKPIKTDSPKLLEQHRYTRQNLRLKMNLGFPRSTPVTAMIQQQPQTSSQRQQQQQSSASSTRQFTKKNERKEMGSTQELVSALNSMVG